MAAIIRNILIGTAVISAPTIGNFVYWVNEKTKDLPANQKGSLFSRMQEAVNSFYQSKQIQDAYTAERHLDFATSLSSKEFTVSSGRAQQETNSLQGSYYAGYIPTALSQYSGIYPPIFRYDTDLPVILPTLPGQTHKGFVFAGASPQIHDSQARGAILNGTYLRCKSSLEIVDPNEESSGDKYKKVDVIVTGTTDQRECGQFKKHYVRDLAYLAAMSRQPFNSEHPYSDTPVFDLSENGFKSTGDLTDMPQQTRMKIMVGHFTFCHFYSLMKTRLSLSDYKEVGAIVAGTLNEDVC